jgi:hypothetical protein
VAGERGMLREREPEPARGKRKSHHGSSGSKQGRFIRHEHTLHSAGSGAMHTS